MDKVRLGVLGAGNIAAMNVQGYLDDPRCDVVAVCDTDEEVGRQAAKEWGGRAYYADLDDMLADDSIDAVEILTPTHLHHDHVIAALEAGKHVSVQKPVANTRRGGPRDAGGGGAGRPDPAHQRVLRALPAARAGQEADRRGRHRQAHRRCASAPWSARPTRPSRPRCAPRATAGASTSGAPAGTSSTTMVHKYAMALWLLDLDITSVQAVVRRRDLFFEPCAVIFEYEDPDVLGHHGGAVLAQALHALELLRRRRVLRDHRRRGADLGHPGHRRDARPGAGHAVHRHAEGARRPPSSPTSTPTGAPASSARRSTSSTRSCTGRRPTCPPRRPPRCCSSASPSTRPPRSAPRSTPAPSPVRSRPPVGRDW